MRWLDGIIVHQYGHKFEQTPGFGDGQGSLGCYGPWVAESDTTE